MASHISKTSINEHSIIMNNLMAMGDNISTKEENLFYELHSCNERFLNNEFKYDYVFYFDSFVNITKTYDNEIHTESFYNFVKQSIVVINESKIKKNKKLKLYLSIVKTLSNYYSKL